MRVLITRPEPDNAKTAALVREHGHEPVLLPLLEFAPLNDPLPDPERFSAMVLTSANGARALAERGDAARVAHLPVFAVGGKTKMAAKAAGLSVKANGQGNVDDLVRVIEREGVSGPLFYPAARHRARDLEALLAEAGIAVHTFEIYDMRIPETLPALDEPVGAALFYSRRTAETFLRLGRPGNPAGLICISRNVAQPLAEAGLDQIRIAGEPDEKHMIEALLSWIADHSTSF